MGLLLSAALLGSGVPAFAQTKAQQVKPASPAVPSVPHTLLQALAATYSYNPALLAQRAQVRATDEGVPQALAGWRPTIVAAGTAGWADGVTKAGRAAVSSERDIGVAQVTVTQPVYTGGRVNATVHRATNAVYAARAALINQEETAFTDTVSAYVGVIQARQTLALNQNNEHVLSEQLRATQDRFRVGEITQTDVAQAQTALASAVAATETARGNVQTAEASYLRAVGAPPPPDLVPPQPLELPVKSEQEAAQLASTNNPQVIQALFNLASARNNVDVAFANLMPQISIQGSASKTNNQLEAMTQQNGYQITANLTMPLYQGGAEYSAVRQARQLVQQNEQLVADARRTAVQSAVAAWDTLVAARAAVKSSQVAIQAGQIALEGTERQALVGTATTLDVLTVQQSLLNTQLTLVQNLASLVNATYQLAAAVGRLTARDLGLPVSLYDDTAYYEAVKNKWWGVSVPDPATLYRTGASTK
ncbi:MAG TPA: TolC family outer membrane protein [Acetobacteraceae bacterium]|nr:TolC family outer membrane protein [Acetobacteraceae bacterium]